MLPGAVSHVCTNPRQALAGPICKQCSRTRGSKGTPAGSLWHSATVPCWELQLPLIDPSGQPVCPLWSARGICLIKVSLARWSTCPNRLLAYALIRRAASSKAVTSELSSSASLSLVMLARVKSCSSSVPRTTASRTRRASSKRLGCGLKPTPGRARFSSERGRQKGTHG